jgi:membrane protein DedA with SNARE-associated domain
LETLTHWVTSYGYFGIFSLLMLGLFGLPVPDETLLMFSGYLVFSGRLEFVPTAIAAFLGSICGITLSFVLGLTAGMRLVGRFGYLVHLTHERVNRVHNWFERFGKWTLVFGYFVPGFRHLTALVAGTSCLEASRFAAFAYSGALIWSLTFISLGYFFGAEWKQTSATFHRYLLIAAGLLVVLFLLYLILRRITRPEQSADN